MVEERKKKNWARSLTKNLAIAGAITTAFPSFSSGSPVADGVTNSASLSINTNNLSANKPSIVYTGDLSNFINQNDVNSLYEDVFNKISQAKKDAEKAKKPLLILTGEIHGDRKGLLIEYVLINVCNQLGINKASFEWSDEVTKRMLLDARKEEENGINYILASPISSTYTNAPDWAQRLFLTRLTDYARANYFSVKGLPEEGNTQARLLATDALGMQSSGVDKPGSEKLSPEQAGDPDTIKEREKYQLEQYRKDPTNSVSVVGDIHEPALFSALKDTYQIAAFYAETAKPVEHPTNPKTKEFYDDRMSALTTNTYIQPLSIAGAPLSPDEALRMTAIASLDYRTKHNIISQQDAQNALKLLSIAFPHPQKNSPAR